MAQKMKTYDSLRGRRKKGRGRGEGEKHERGRKSPSLFPLFPIPYPFRRLLCRLTYDEMSTTKGHSKVPQESQDYVLSSADVERNKLNAQCMFSFNPFMQEPVYANLGKCRFLLAVFYRIVSCFYGIALFLSQIILQV